MIQYDDDARRGLANINVTGVELASWLIVDPEFWPSPWCDHKARRIVEYMFNNLSKNNIYGDR